MFEKVMAFLFVIGVFWMICLSIWFETYKYEPNMKLQNGSLVINENYFERTLRVFEEGQKKVFIVNYEMDSIAKSEILKNNNVYGFSKQDCPTKLSRLQIDSNCMCKKEILIVSSDKVENW